MLSSARRSFSVKELADELRCSKSTIERDLSTIEALYPLREEPVGKQRLRYRIDARPSDLELMPRFGIMQLAAVEAALAILRPLEGTPFYRDLQVVSQVMRGWLADRENGRLARLRQLVLPGGPQSRDQAANAEVIDTLVDGILRRRQCRFSLRESEGKDTQVDACPLHFVYRDERLLTLLWLGGKDTFRLVRVDQIAAVSITDQAFTPPRLPPGRLQRLLANLQP